ncbi:MAG: NTP transferase domain-containing protein [Myxococcales bacterium]|nr:NTP transferase domain-containing protein [Myxococcales bacterium]
MIRQALILAAGMGTRIREGGSDIPKPLHTVLGIPLLKRTIWSLANAGITRFGVVVGYRAELIREAIESDPDYAARGLQIELIENPEYEKSNGVSVLAARGHFDGPFVLTMADHVFDDGVAECAAFASMEVADLHLCVDYRIDDIYDMDDATKVATVDGPYINTISKQLTQFDCVDCGVFAVSLALLDELDEVLQSKGDCSLSEGVARLATKRRARVVDIGSCFWQDVDTQSARERAERILEAADVAPSLRAAPASRTKPPEFV